MVAEKEKLAFAKRLNEACDEAGIPARGRRVYLAKRLKVSGESARKWLEGLSIPDTKRIPPLASILHVTGEWLLTGQGPKRLSTSPPQAAVAPGPEIRGRVPLVSWTTAGHWAEVVDNFQPGDAEDWIVTTAHVGPQAFALRIQGDSMEPLIQDGSIVIVDPDTAPRHRSVVIVRQNDDREATCKRLVYDAGRPYLRPENPRYPAMEMADDAIIVGVVRQVIQELE